MRNEAYAMNLLFLIGVLITFSRGTKFDEVVTATMNLKGSLATAPDPLPVDEELLVNDSAQEVVPSTNPKKLSIMVTEYMLDKMFTTDEPLDEFFENGQVAVPEYNENVHEAQSKKPNKELLLPCVIVKTDIGNVHQEMTIPHDLKDKTKIQVTEYMLDKMFTTSEPLDEFFPKEELLIAKKDKPSPSGYAGTIKKQNAEAVAPLDPGDILTDEDIDRCLERLKVTSDDGNLHKDSHVQSEDKITPQTAMEREETFKQLLGSHFCTVSDVKPGKKVSSKGKKHEKTEAQIHYERMEERLLGSFPGMEQGVAKKPKKKWWSKWKRHKQSEEPATRM
ncbi:hypothetical protein BdWA1_000929 [Babesia duncani]|uniref:Uncharacterized protein n=1 Tax=Babesia duncani TaxID=323732 RepID=A0AAD9PN72_9APIC|nr:hypothetical protein BdWA1_000929 [Babesia duncani]